MAKKFLSFLGTSDYKECTYIYTKENREIECTTKYIQEALIKALCSDWTGDDKAIIFLTEKARKNNWTNEEIIERRLEENLKHNKNIDVADVSIPDGKSVEEIWEIFDILCANIDDKDEVIFDITHSFRSIPMLALVVLNYVKVVKDIKLTGIYYGAYEAKELVDDKEIAPIFNLTSFDELLEWSQAVNSFLKYGNSMHLKEISVKTIKDGLKNGNKNYQEVNNFIQRLNDFTNCIYTCRGKCSKDINKNPNTKSIKIAYENMEKCLEKIQANKNDSVKPLVPLFDKIQERTKDFKNADNFYTGMAVVKWSIDNNLTQQAYTAFEETIKTYVCIKFGLDETIKDHREEFAAKALKIKAKNISEDKWIIAQKYRNDKDYRETLKNIVSGLDEEISKLSDTLSQKRNDINHFGYKDNVLSYEALNCDIKNLYERFNAYVEHNKI